MSRIVDLMVADEWEKGKTGAALAAEWGISASRVEDLSAEASRIVRRAVGEPKEIKKRLLSGLQQAMERTLAKGEYRTMIEAARTIGGFHGLVRDRLELTKPGDDFDGWSVEEVEAYVSSGVWPARLLKGGGGGSPAPSSDGG